ncbi:DJ-1/PfpI family protein [Paenibacillus sp. SC116]|uniref:DJ-1/PfpI family protein n=1 Tax=Paenibacillus sp. SC116 TaxID=2968986 RepID=UPI00215A9536|nr:DJ-1/PfpI family protein [Paenibacillus sp. SC116]MCR8843536.1 DJ-1/PfpI family protein [Paenibacillus sp. SC116]
MKNQWNVGILLFEDVDVMDYSGPYEVFNLSFRDANQVQEFFESEKELEGKPFNVKTIAQHKQLITADHGLKVMPDFCFDTYNQTFDIVIIPGGPLKAIKSGMNNKEVLNWIVSQHKAGATIASVCTGAFFLAAAGLLTNKKATTNILALDFLENQFSDVEVVRNVRFVDNGDVLTSAGISAGIDMSMYIVERLLGIEAARTATMTMEYPYYESASIKQ